MSTTRTSRTVVFIDYQNMYRSARDAFGWASEKGHFGNFRPYGLGRQMVREQDRLLTEVRVYTGIHTPVGNAVQNAMMQRRMAAWIAEQPDKIQVFPRPLRYSPRRPQGEEKGSTSNSRSTSYASRSTIVSTFVFWHPQTPTLSPHCSSVADRFPAKTIVTLGLEPIPSCEAKTPAPLDLPRGAVSRRRIPQSDFDRMVDKNNYYEASSDLSKTVDPVRWERIGRRFG